MKEKRNLFSATCGNFFKHVDLSLYGLLLPLFSQLFFPNSSRVIALVKGSLILSLAAITKPLGALFFGKIAQKKRSNQYAFSLSLLGMGMTTLLFSALPNYERIGGIATVALLLLRTSQTFFASGETMGGAILLLQNLPESRKTFFSSLYDSTSIAGYLVGALSISCLTFCYSIEKSWRALYFIAGLITIFTIPLRQKQGLQEKIFPTPLKTIICNRKFVYLTLLSGYSHLLFSFAFIFFPSWIPLISNISYKKIWQTSPLFFVIDMLLLPFFGYLFRKSSLSRLMQITALLIAFSLPFSLYLCQGATFINVALIRMFMIGLATVFSCGFHHFMQQQVSDEKRYLALSLSYAIGSQLIGLPTSVVTFYLFSLQKGVWVTSLYITSFSLLTFLAISKLTQQRRNPMVLPTISQAYERV